MCVFVTLLFSTDQSFSSSSDFSSLGGGMVNLRQLSARELSLSSDLDAPRCAEYPFVRRNCGIRFEIHLLTDVKPKAPRWRNST